MSGSHFRRPRLDLAAADLHRRAAIAADQVVVVFRGGAAGVNRFAGVDPNGVHLLTAATTPAALSTRSNSPARVRNSGATGRGLLETVFI